MAQKYNPLLKFGFQETGGGGEAEQIAALQEAVSVLQVQAATLQNALTTLKGNKITKCFSKSDFAALEQNEIFEWQGVDSTIDDVAFKNSFFYKKTVSPSVVVAPVQAADVTNCGFVYNDVLYQNGLYYQKDGSQLNPLSESFYIVRFYGGTIPANVGLWTILNGSLARGQVFKYIVNGVITNIVLDEFYRIGQGGAFHLTFTNGLELESQAYGGNIITYFRTVVDTNNNYYYLGFDAEASTQGDNFLFLDENYNVVDFVPCYSHLTTINHDVTISVATYQQTDTQPQPPVADRNHTGLMNKSFFEFSTWSDNFGLIIQKFGCFCFLFCIPYNHTNSSTPIPVDYAPNDGLEHIFFYTGSMRATLQGKSLFFSNVVTSLVYTPCFFTYIIV